jgi:hypothetical protein
VVVRRNGQAHDFDRQPALTILGETFDHSARPRPPLVLVAAAAIAQTPPAARSRAPQSDGARARGTRSPAMRRSPRPPARRRRPASRSRPRRSTTATTTGDEDQRPAHAEPQGRRHPRVHRDGVRDHRQELIVDPRVEGKVNVSRTSRCGRARSTRCSSPCCACTATPPCRRAA